MFDFWRFYNGLADRLDYFDNYWDKFPKGRLLRFKGETLSLLKTNLSDKDAQGLFCTLAVILNDGADRDYTETLLVLLDEKWHTSEEDIVSALELVGDPKSVGRLYDVAVEVPDYDEMRALAKKCMWALTPIENNLSELTLSFMDSSLTALLNPILSLNPTGP